MTKDGLIGTLMSSPGVCIAAAVALLAAVDGAAQAAPSAPAVSLPEVRVELCGWRIEGQWKQAARPTLSGTATCLEGGDALLSFTFPQMGRDHVARVRLAAQAKTVPFEYVPPLANGGNARNVYRLVVEVAGEDARASKTFLLAGTKSAGVNLGAPRSSRQIAASRLGTNTHFSFGRSGAFAGWKEYERLLDEVAQSGLKWIREGTRLQRDPDGTAHVDPYDLGWIRAARERGIDVILIIGMNAGQPLDEFVRDARAIVQDTRDLVHVYELGNEPNNFGGWIKQYGGTWNGKEPDNSTSPWVKAHLRYTNAAAEAIKKIAPNATVIGLGACTCTNFRYLDLGVSPALDGVVDHPYGYALPAEFVPWSWGVAERDGVKVGDDVGSFEGLVRSYLDKFQATGRPRTLWVTEFGYSAFWFDGTNEKGLYAGYSERAQAIYLLRRFLLSLTLPIEVSCQYDLYDDYGSKMDNCEANFGLLRGDYSRKPAYAAVQRMASLMDGYAPDPDARATVEKETLHAHAERVIKGWDDPRVHAANAVKAFAFRNERQPNERLLALWSAQPAGGEHNDRAVTLRLKGWKEFGEPPVAIRLLSGASFDLPVKVAGDDLLLENVLLTDEPLLVKFFRRE